MALGPSEHSLPVVNPGASICTGRTLGRVNWLTSIDTRAPLRRPISVRNGAGRRRTSGATAAGEAAGVPGRTWVDRARGRRHRLGWS